MKNRIIFTVVTACALGFGGMQTVSAGAIVAQTRESTVIGAAKGAIPATSSVQDLEATLKSTYVGTYVIYGSLPEQQKLTLYAAVKQGGNIQDFREQVIKMRLHRR
ncbi:hypothetical protein [Thiolapillus sp.]